MHLFLGWEYEWIQIVTDIEMINGKLLDLPMVCNARQIAQAADMLSQHHSLQVKRVNPII